MKYVYPAVFHPESEGGYSVYFPDINCGATQGETVTECIEMAEDFLCLALYNMEKEKKQIAEISSTKSIITKPDDIVTLIAVDTNDYHHFYENTIIKKTLNIPLWLSDRAENANINLSHTLQKALKEELRISDAM